MPSEEIFVSFLHTKLEGYGFFNSFFKIRTIIIDKREGKKYYEAHFEDFLRHKKIIYHVFKSL